MPLYMSPRGVLTSSGCVCLFVLLFARSTPFPGQPRVKVIAMWCFVGESTDSSMATGDLNLHINVNLPLYRHYVGIYVHVSSWSGVQKSQYLGLYDSFKRLKVPRWIYEYLLSKACYDTNR